MPNSSALPTRMSAPERRATVLLALIFALRMLGLFMLMPVFSLYAKGLPGGDNTLLVGIALGIYGLAQAMFYIPYGWASDWLGRKLVIVAGLFIFALGSVVAALAHNLTWVIVGRALQGAGAISSVVMALIADLTQPQNRTKAMAMVGAGVGVSFAIALVVAPILFNWFGMSALFGGMGGLAVISIALVLWLVPEPAAAPQHHKVPFRDVLRDAELLRLNAGVFVLHATQIALFIVLPRLLVDEAGLAMSAHWKIYLPVMLLSFLLMLPAIFAAERRGKVKTVMLMAIVCTLIGQLLMIALPHTLAWMASMLLVYFTGFNVLEAVQPSLVSKLAPGARRGAAMGVYNTTQALGYFAGGALSGWLLKTSGPTSVFIFCAALLFVWLMLATTMKRVLPANRTYPQNGRSDAHNPAV